MPRAVAGSVTGGALLATSPLSGAVTQLEVAERELMAQHGDAVARVTDLDRQLTTTRDAIAALRGLGATPAPLPQPSSAPVRTTVRNAASRADTGGGLAQGKKGAAAAAARERALLDFMVMKPRERRDLFDLLPQPAGVTKAQHDRSVCNAMTRLSSRALIVRREDGWTLTAKGRSAAAAAKEAP